MNRSTSSPDSLTTGVRRPSRLRTSCGRVCGAVLAAVAGTAISTGAIAAPASAQPNLTVGYFTGLIAEPETVIGSSAEPGSGRPRTHQMGPDNRRRHRVGRG